MNFVCYAWSNMVDFIFRGLRYVKLVPPRAYWEIPGDKKPKEEKQEVEVVLFVSWVIWARPLV